jgi:hypothetical protein
VRKPSIPKTIALFLSDRTKLNTVVKTGRVIILIILNKNLFYKENLNIIFFKTEILSHVRLVLNTYPQIRNEFLPAYV